MDFRTLGKYYYNIKGWRTNRKIIVIESDDWGSIRMPSKKVYLDCLKKGYPVDRNVYEKYDSLASKEDLELLFELLLSFKDKHGNPPVITANCMVANPDFERIEDSGFAHYFYESVTETFKKYPQHADNLKLWEWGLQEKVFYPQCHGREHLNVSLFMHDLKRRNEDAMFGFNNRMPGSIPKAHINKGNKYVEAMQASSSIDKNNKLEIFKEALDLFNEMFGYRSLTLTPPNYIWSPEFNPAIIKKGVKFIQSIRVFNEPVEGQTNKIHKVFLGKKCDSGIRYLVRNVTFEPSIYQQEESHCIDQCLRDIEVAFKMGKPAVISSHRINFVGFIDPLNRDRNLVMLGKILKKVMSKWEDIEFMTSAQLGHLMIHKETLPAKYETIRFNPG